MSFVISIDHAASAVIVFQALFASGGMIIAFNKRHPIIRHSRRLLKKSKRRV